MSLRIHNDPSTGIAPPDVGRTGQPTAQAPGAGKARTASEGGDQVEVSSVSESISSGISAQNLTQAARVKQLSALYASGQYSVDSGQVSSALVSNAITGSSAGKA